MDGSAAPELIPCGLFSTSIHGMEYVMQVRYDSVLDDVPFNTRHTECRLSSFAIGRPVRVQKIVAPTNLARLR